MGKKLLALALTLAVLLGLAACGGTETTVTSSTPESSDAADSSVPAAPKEIVDLTLANIPGNPLIGDQFAQWWQEVLRQDVGVQLVFVGGDAATLLASGDLPDIFVSNNNKDVTNAIAGGLLVCLDDYKDQLPNVFQNAEASLRYWRENLSEGTGKAYAVGNNISTVAQSAGTAGWGPCMRWDLYQQIGAPEIATLEDYLTVVKQMQEANPTTEDGQKVYGFSLFPAWDSVNAYIVSDMAGMLGVSIKSFTEINYADNNRVGSIFDDDSTYTRLLHFFFEANQMGLLDPDSISQPYDAYVDKLTSGRGLFSLWNWSFEGFNTAEHVNAGIGFKQVFSKDLKISVSGPLPTGNIWPFCIGKNTEHLDEALAYLDYMYSYDGLMKLANGPQGVVWDLDESGTPYITENGYDIIASNSELPGGGTLDQGLNIVNSYGLSKWMIHPEYNVPIERTAWPKKDFAPADTTLDKSWKEFYGAEDQIRYLTQNNLSVVIPYAPMDVTPDEIQQIDTKVGAIVTQLSWKMMYAKDEAEFQALKKDMAEQAFGMGAQTSIDWYTEAFTKALETGKKFSE